MNTIYVITGIYAIFSTIWYIKQWKTKWFGLYPFGITFYLFTPLLNFLGEKLKSIWQKLGYVAYRFFAVFYLSFIPLIILPIITSRTILPRPSWLNIVISYIFPVDIIDFSDITFLVIILIAFFIHEFFHGFIARAHDIDIENTGLFFIPNFLIAAYVKPNYKKWMADHLKNPILQEELIQEYNLSENQIRSYFRKRGINSEGIVFERDDNPNGNSEIQETPLNGKTKQEEKTYRDLESFLYSDPLGFEQEKIRIPAAEVASIGLFGNFLFLLIGIPFIVFPQYGLMNLGILIIKSNMLFITLNIIPLPITDGGKVLHSKLVDWFDKDVGNRIHRFMIFIFLYLLLFLIVT